MLSDPTIPIIGYPDDYHSTWVGNIMRLKTERLSLSELI